MAQSFLQRYLDGEHEQVWSDLLALGERVGSEPIRSDARAVAQATMRRARYNIEVLIKRLHTLGFQFAELSYAEVPHEPPPADVREQIAWVERVVGPLPLSLCAWYEIVGGVYLNGTHPEWDSNAYPDPLWVEPVRYALGEYEEWQYCREEDGFDETGPYEIPIAPDYKHKANVSGGSAYSIAVPNAQADALLLNEWHETTFVNYLRTCLRWGGFPGWERERSRPQAHLDYLTEGLLTI